MKCVAFFIVVCQLAFTKYCVLADSGGPSTRLLNFASTFSGIFRNSKQVSDDAAFEVKRPHDPVTLTFLPVDIPALRPDITFYKLETDNGKMLRKMVLVITENAEGSIFLTPYNFTDSDRFGDTVPDLTDLVGIKAEDLIIRPEECMIAFTAIGDGIYSGTWPNCENMIDGSYGITLTCKSYSGVANMKGALEKGNLIPYVFQKRKSFPLPEYWTEDAGDWVSPCSNV